MQRDGGSTSIVDQPRDAPQLRAAHTWSTDARERDSAQQALGAAEWATQHGGYRTLIPRPLHDALCGPDFVKWKEVERSRRETLRKQEQMARRGQPDACALQSADAGEDEEENSDGSVPVGVKTGTGDLSRLA